VTTILTRGVTDEDMKHIFHEGYSGAFAQLAGKSGKGIGLSRVQKLLKLNNASIEIENNIAGFTTKVKKEVSYQR
jgi:sensor histidine kinase regulating citrate/malate metabolism